ncbi:MAG TPA: prenyltransferase/squalene oxidase repeat-containing protein [Thermoplasmata archaeon]|nr:prenyltransferase/squalene oxidase repeat-containing protein [Thermoplasmata archaeon]
MSAAPRIRQWLAGPSADPSVRLRYWSEVEGRPASDARVRSARRSIGRLGWAAELLSRQFPDGHWVTRGSTGRELYRPKYIATNWCAIVLGDLGMTRDDRRIRRAAELILSRWRRDLHGRGAEICITGNAVRTLIRFGYLEHATVQRSIDWIVDAQKADGGWHCFPSRRGTLDGWEGLAALAEIPEARRNGSVRRSIERGAEFFLSRHLMEEGRERYGPWFRIHYPNHYYYDVLVGLRILTRLGYGSDPRLEPALDWLTSKRRPDGTWALDTDHPDIDVRLADYAPQLPVFPMRLETPNEPSRWATVEALSVLARRVRS